MLIINSHHSPFSFLIRLKHKQIKNLQELEDQQPQAIPTTLFPCLKFCLSDYKKKKNQINVVSHAWTRFVPCHSTPPCTLKLVSKTVLLPNLVFPSNWITTPLTQKWLFKKKPQQTLSIALRQQASIFPQIKGIKFWLIKKKTKKQTILYLQFPPLKCFV